MDAALADEILAESGFHDGSRGGPAHAAFVRDTTSSNPLSSSGESRANLTRSIRAAIEEIEYWSRDKRRFPFWLIGLLVRSALEETREIGLKSGREF
jgi:hypothetical protein